MTPTPSPLTQSHPEAGSKTRRGRYTQFCSLRVHSLRCASSHAVPNRNPEAGLRGRCHTQAFEAGDVAGRLGFGHVDADHEVSDLGAVSVCAVCAAEDLVGEGVFRGGRRRICSWINPARDP